VRRRVSRGAGAVAVNTGARGQIEPALTAYRKQSCPPCARLLSVAWGRITSPRSVNAKSTLFDGSIGGNIGIRRRRRLGLPDCAIQSLRSNEPSSASASRMRPRPASRPLGRLSLEREPWLGAMLVAPHAMGSAAGLLLVDRVPRRLPVPRGVASRDPLICGLNCMKCTHYGRF
jgi:hypothetical protein